MMLRGFPYGSMPGKAKNRIEYIDWMRGLASILMLQGHCFDSWLSEAGRNSRVFGWSHWADTLPAPMFLFLSGFSVAVVTDKFRERGLPADTIVRRIIKRGGQIFLLGLVFRVQEYLFGRPWAPWTDLFRVDILNVIGLSLMMLGLACRISATGNLQDPRQVRRASITTAIVACMTVALFTPQLYTNWRPRWLPWWLESYVNGVHNANAPQPWLFPLFPWSAFAFAGLAVGFWLVSDWARKNETTATRMALIGGLALIAIGFALDALPLHFYGNYDFWHTSPNYFLIRTGILLVILKASHFWWRLGAANWGFSPLMELGKCSLLIYWVHPELVYGKYSLLTRGSAGVAQAMLWLLVIYAGMIALAVVRNRLPSNLGEEIMAFFRRPARSQSSLE
jgi:uncharacterized membrane protein